MRIVLSLLVAFTLFQANCFALVGGPNYGGGDFNGSVVGTYAGTLLTTDISGDLTAPVPVSTTLGIFTISVPDTGAASGSVFIFQDGSSFQGSLAGIGDPGRGTISGIINAYRIISASVTDTSSSFTYDAKASGGFVANIGSSSSSYSSLYAARLSGQAQVEVKELDFTTFAFVSKGTETYFIDGYRQSESTSTISTSIADLLGL